MRANDKLNPHMKPNPAIEPRPHWWEASALTMRHPCSPAGTHQLVFAKTRLQTLVGASSILCPAPY